MAVNTKFSVTALLLWLLWTTTESHQPPPLPNALKGSEWEGNSLVIDGAPSHVVSGEEDPVHLSFAKDDENAWKFVGGTTACDYLIAATVPCELTVVGRERRGLDINKLSKGVKEEEEVKEEHSIKTKKGKGRDDLCGFWVNKCAQTNEELPALNWCNSFRIVNNDMMYVYSQSAEPDTTPSCPLTPREVDFEGSAKQLTARTKKAGGNEAFGFRRVEPSSLRQQ